jgi:hypothetical protein
VERYRWDMETKRVFMHGQWVDVKVLKSPWEPGYERERELVQKNRFSRNRKKPTTNYRLNQPHIKRNRS